MIQKYTDIDQEQLSRWCLDEGHLLLCAPITKEDESDGMLDFDKFWGKTIESIYGKEIGWGVVDESEYRRIYKKTEKYFNKSFRKNLGVWSYYQLKRDEAGIYADEIMSFIKTDIEKTKNAEDIINICLSVENYLKNVKESLSSKNNEIEFNIRNYHDKQYYHIKLKFSFFSILKKILFRSKYLFSLKELQKYYINQTFWYAIYFADRLIPEICNRLESLRNELNTRNHKDTEQLKTVDKKIETFEIKQPTFTFQQLNHHNNLIIGLGGIGGRVLIELRKRMFDEGLLLTDGHHQLPIAFMYIDSTDELMHNDDPFGMTFDGYNAQFSYNEFLNIGTIQPATIIEHLDYYPTVKDIVGKNNSKMFMYSGPATGQNRRIGRILFAANAQRFNNMLQEKGHQLSMLTRHDGPEYIYIVTGLAGGTGSGIVVDVIAQVHKRYPHAVIFVMVALPTIPPPNGHDQGHYFANVYAALKELNALNVDAFKPLDMMTSGQRVDTNSQEKLQFTLIPFENGSIADCLHSFLTIINPPRDEYANCIYREISRYAPGVLGHWIQWEYSTIEPEKDKPVRTLALASYAQKIVVHPKDLILRRISYSMLDQFMRQMCFNNYCNTKGYDNAGAHTYAYYLMIIDSMREEWHIDIKSLTLQCPFSFIPHDSSYSFQDEWENMAYFFFHDSAVLESSRDERFDLLEKLYIDYFHNHYRNYGVKGYFNKRVCVADHYAQEICHIIQHDLFMRWIQGDYGIIDLIEIVKVVVDYLREENNYTNKRIEKYNEQTEKCREEMESVRKDYALSNILIRALHAEQYLKRYNDCLKEYHIVLTHIHSIEFEKHLINKLINRLLELENRLMNISTKLAEMGEESNRIAEELRNESEDHHNTHSPIVDLSNEDAIQYCINRLIADKDVMERLSTLLRQKIAEHYDDLRHLEYLNMKDLPYLVKMQAKEIEINILNMGAWLGGSFYNPLYEDTLTALLHRNVINREHVNQFAYECINGLVMPLQLDEEELMKVVPNNPLPGPIGNTKAFVSLPKPKNEEEERLSQELENAFRAAYHNIHVNTAEARDEITIISLRTRFPIRAIHILPKLKALYDSYIAENTDKALGLLYTEDSCCDLPSLEAKMP